jgi:hypothetical protein
MALRRLLARLPIAALALCAWTACKGKGDAAKGAAELDPRCDQLAKTCADNDKHRDKLAGECKQAANQEIEKGCADKTKAAYDCYEKELCGKTDKVWALDDLRVLADRQNKCASERNALTDCITKK